MNEFDDIESMLNRLPLKAPSAQLDRKVRRAIHRHLAWFWMAGAGLAAAASLLLALWLNGGDSPQPLQMATTTQMAPASDEIQFLTTTQRWVDDGIVSYAEEGPIRQYRLQTVQAVTQLDTNVLDEQVVQVVSAAY